MNGMKEMSIDNTDFLEKIFQSVDKKCTGYVKWDQFFATVKLVSSNNLQDKIDLFFNIVDSDGNGSFSFDEIKDICKFSISKIAGNEHDDGFTEEFSDFYAKYIFKMLGKENDYDLEIPT